MIFNLEKLFMLKGGVHEYIILMEKWFSYPVKIHGTQIWVKLKSPANGHPSTKGSRPMFL